MLRRKPLPDADDSAGVHTLRMGAMRFALCIGLACCGGHRPPTPPKPTPTESLIADAAKKLQQLQHQHECVDTCCSALDPSFVPALHAPQLDVPQAELRRIARASMDPLTVALALTWLSRQNDPADLSFVAALAERGEVVPWVRIRRRQGRVFTFDLGSLRGPLGGIPINDRAENFRPQIGAIEEETEEERACPKVDWQVAMLGEVALDAASHITGRAFRSPEEMKEWIARRVDPRDTIEYWKAHLDQVERLFARDPFLYLRVRFETDPFGREREIPGANAFLPPPKREWQRSLDDVATALRDRAHAFVELVARDDWPWVGSALEFAIDHYDTLQLGRFSAEWKAVWQREQAQSRRYFFTSIAIVASWSSNDPEILERAAEQAVDVPFSHDSLYQAHLARWPDRHAALFNRLPSADARHAFVNALLPKTHIPSSSLRPVLKQIVTAASNERLLEVIDDVFMVVTIADREWVAPFPRDEVFSAPRSQQKSPSPVLKRTMEAIRARVKTW